MVRKRECERKGEKSSNQERPPWWRSIRMKEKPDERPPDERPPNWETSLMKDQHDEWPPWWETTWWRTTLMNIHPDEGPSDKRPPWWMTTLMGDQPFCTISSSNLSFSMHPWSGATPLCLELLGGLKGGLLTLTLVWFGLPKCVYMSPWL